MNSRSNLVLRVVLAVLFLFVLDGCSFSELNVEEEPIAAITITDVDGKVWDITTAVVKYGFVAEEFDFGLGKNFIVPLDHPRLVGPGDRGYPSDEATFLVVGTNINGDVRAYGQLDIIRNEVVNETIGEAHVAVSY